MAEIIASGFSSFTEQSAIALDGASTVLPIWQNPAFQEKPYHPITPSWRRPRTVVTNT